MGPDEEKRLRPMFSYYGSKWRLAPKYPPPKHRTIIEPFAGSACYSLLHWKHKVILIDLDPAVAGVWRFLIKSSPSDILKLPLLEQDQSVDTLKVCQEARWLIGFWCGRGREAPCKTLSKWSKEKLHNCWGERARLRIASQVQSVHHWKVFERSYAEVMNHRATWFVDPPYQKAGVHYRKGSKGIRFGYLGSWCQNRRGQVIVCENEGANWLPFKPFATTRNTHNQKRDESSKEVIWTKGC